MAGAPGLIRAPFVLAAEGALETTTVRIFANRPGICVAPQYIAEPLLQAEGFNDVRFVGLTATTGAPAAQAVGSGNADFTDLPRRWPSRSMAARRSPAGRRACRLLRVVRARRDPQHYRSEGQECRRARFRLEPDCSSLRWRPMSGSTRARTSTGSSDPAVKPTELCANGKIDAFVGFPPEPQELRVRTIGQ